MSEGGRRINYKRTWEKFEEWCRVSLFLRGDGFIWVHMSKLTNVYTLNMYTLLYVNYTSNKVVNKYLSHFDKWNILFVGKWWNNIPGLENYRQNH